MSASQDSQRTAQALADMFRVVDPTAMPQVRRYGDTGDKATLDLLVVADSPKVGVTAYGTVGLSRHQPGLPDDLRVELVGAFPSDLPDFADLLVGCAFNAVDNDAPLAPGVIYADAMAAHGLSPILRHVLLAYPTSWGDLPPPLPLSDRTVIWLMAVPISEAERAYADTHGLDALEQVFERENVDVLDAARKSAI